MNIRHLLPELVNDGEIVSVPEIIGRMMDNGYKTIPTSGSVAYALNCDPEFEKVPGWRRTHYRRQKYDCTQRV